MQRILLGVFAAPVMLAYLATGGNARDHKDELKKPSESPTALPRIPAPDPAACQLPPGFSVQLVTSGLFYPTSIAFDDAGGMYIAEAGESPGDEASPARVLRYIPDGNNGRRIEVVADQLSAPVNDILIHGGRILISHRGKISAVEGGAIRDLVTGLPSLGDHTNNQMAVGPDGKIYFGQGTATNSGVVGLDNFAMGWLKQHPTVSDVLPKDVELRSGLRDFEMPDMLALFTKQELKKTKTGAFQSFGKQGDDKAKIKGVTKSNATILRMDPDGSNLEVFASGIRNPYGLKFASDGKLYASESTMDDRGSRPVANVPDCIWEIKKDAWYGWPDFAAGVPVTDARFKPKEGPAPQFLLKDHPTVEKPKFETDPHASATKFDFGRGAFGDNVMYLALHGDLSPVTGSAPDNLMSYMVAKIDMKTWKAEPFFHAKKDALGPKGFEYVATAGVRRPIDVHISPRGDAMFVVDFGPIAMLPSGVGASPKSFPGHGSVWLITPTATR